MSYDDDDDDDCLHEILPPVVRQCHDMRKSAHAFVSPQCNGHLYKKYKNTFINYCLSSVTLVLLICCGMHVCCVFFTARHYASAVLGVVILSVRLSVHPSVCHTSHACFVTNPRNLPAIFLYHMKGNPSSFLPPNSG